MRLDKQDIGSLTGQTVKFVRGKLDSEIERKLLARRHFAPPAWRRIYSEALALTIDTI
jgi:hypothetical protein